MTFDIRSRGETNVARGQRSFTSIVVHQDHHAATTTLTVCAILAVR